MRPSCYLAFLLILLAASPLFSQQVRECGGRETIRIYDGDADQITCAEDTTGVIEFRVSSFATPFVIAVTNTDNIIQAISMNNKVDFSALGPGRYRVYGLFFKGNLLAKPGTAIDTDILSDYCYGLSTNFVEINTQEPDAGIITDLDGSAQHFICPDDQADLVPFQRSGMGGEFTYVITDTNQVVAALTQEDSFDFNTLNLTEYRVYGVAYIGNLLLSIGDTLSQNDLLSDGCFDLSDNFLSVLEVAPNAGMVQLTNGTTSTLLCPSDAFELTFEAVGTSPTPFTFVLTDEQDIILEVLDSNTTTFADLNPAVYRIYGVSYIGNPNINIGDTLTSEILSDDCFAISQNAVDITIQLVDGAQVSLEDGSRMTEVCVMDGESDELIFINNTTATSANYAYIITNENDEIILPLIGDRIDFDVDLITGVNRVYGLSYTGNLNLSSGQNITSGVLSDACYSLSSTFVTIVKSLVVGGNVSLTDSTTATAICPEGRLDTIHFLTTGTSTESYGYAAVGPDGVVVLVSDTSFMALGTLAVDTLDIYGLAFTGSLNMVEGALLNEAIFSDGCFAISQNAVRVTTERPENGVLTTIGGSTDTLVCPQAGQPIINLLAPDALGGELITILTDTNDIIQGFSPGLSVSLPSDLPEGSYQLWSANYTGNLQLAEGLSLAETSVSDDCYALSTNSVSIKWEVPFAGSLILSDNSNSAIFCPQNGNADSLSWTAPEANGGSLVYLLTDTLNQIIHILESPVLDGDTLGLGSYRIHGLAYTGNLLATIGQNAGSASLSDGCYQLSTSFITLDAIQPNGGEISLSEGNGIFCSGDGTPDILSFTVLGQEEQANYTFLVTDMESTFLFDLGDSTSYDFESILGGQLNIYGLSYTGELSVQVGDTVTSTALTTDCFSLSSNSIQVDRQEVDGGSVSTLDGRTTAFVCAGDGNPDVLEFANTGLSDGSNYRYVITTNTDIVVNVLSGNSLDFENTGFSELRIWGVSYAGNLSNSISGNIHDVIFSDACYELSDNFLTINRDQPENSRISDLTGQTDVIFCPGPDGDQLELFQTSTSLSGYFYAIMDQSNSIIEITEDDVIDMENYAVGDYQIIGVSYTGRILVAPQDTIDPDTTSFSDDCFVVSDNIMTLRKGGEVDGKSLNTISGMFTFYTCPGDSIGDPLVVLVPTDTLSADYRIVITDEHNSLFFPFVLNPVIDFNPADPGIYRIYGISYTGEYTPQFGADLFNSDISSECYEPSSNFIEVFNFRPEESLISTSSGITEVNMVSDMQEVVTFRQQGAQSGLPYRYIITDLDNTIITVLSDSLFSADQLSVGNYRVWGVNHAGMLTAETGIQADSDPLADNCFVLSGNFISLNIENPAPRAFDISSSARKLGLHPNPALDRLAVTFELKQPELLQDNVRLQVLNTSGTVMIDREIGIIMGHNQIEINIANLQQGMYLIRLTNGGVLVQSRFLKINP